MAEVDKNLEFLNRQLEEGVPAFFESLSSDQLAEIREYVEAVVERKTAGLEKMFEASHTIVKFLPNFMIQMLTNRFIDPPIAARISERLPVKETVGLGKTMTIEYVAETTIYMQNEYACRVLEQTQRQRAILTFAKLAEISPLKALELSFGFDEYFLATLVANLDVGPMLQATLKKEEQRAGLEKIKKIKSL